MKIIRLISVVLASVLLLMCLPSCSSVVKVKVKFTAIVEDPNGNSELLCGPLEGEISGTKDNPPTVLDSAVAILEANSISFKADDKSITSISSKSEGSKDGYLYVWVYEINGKEPEEGQRAYNIEVNEGDVIVYYFRPQIDKTQTVDTSDDSSSDTNAPESVTSAET